MDLMGYVREVAPRVNKFIEEVVKGSPQTLYDAAMHLIRAGGKRLRPITVLLSARLVGGAEAEDKALPGAAAVEILHNFTLIHDDIIDKDEFRRGVPTVHKLWGEGMAIVAGDLLYAYAYRALLKAEERGVDPVRVKEAVKYLTEGAIRVAEGQALDMLLSRRLEASLDEYIRMVEGKTAALFMSSAAIGAVLAGGDQAIIAHLREVMRLAGIAFQIRDDILGLVADEKTLGKPVYSDIREGKRTVLVIYALRKLSDGDRKRLLAILGKGNASREELEEAAELIKSTGAVEFADSLAEDYARRSMEKLSRVSEMARDLEALRLLRELIEYLVKRRY